MCVNVSFEVMLKKRILDLRSEFLTGQAWFFVKKLWLNGPVPYYILQVWGVASRNNEFLFQTLATCELQ